MRRAMVILLPAIASSLATAILFVLPCFAWKFLGIDGFTCFGLFMLELFVAAMGALLLLEWIDDGEKNG